ncbi:MAG: endonuclease V, partial [Halobacteriota archaeon]
MIRPALHPDRATDREGMLDQQRAVVAAATFGDDGVPGEEPRTVAGVDQAFVDGERVVSAAVVLQDGEPIERTYAVEPLERPYVPGYLSFREGPAAIGAIERLREPVDAFARWINGQPAPVVALDVPTGLDSDTGMAQDDAVRADLTVTMAARKAGLLFNDGPEHAGRIEVVDIGVRHIRVGGNIN